MDFNTVELHFPMYGIYQDPNFGSLRLDNTKDFIEGMLDKEREDPIVSEYVSENLSISKGLRSLENRHQTNPSLNSKLDKTQGQTIGGRLFRPKRNLRSKYL